MAEIFYGVVEDRDSDPKKLGRCKVRIVGIHTEDAKLLPTKDLPWAYPLMPVHSASMSGIGYSPTGIVEGTWVACSFRDQYQQQPIIIGTLGGIPEDETPEPVSKVTITETIQDTLKDSNGNTVLDGFGNPVVTGVPHTVTTQQITEPPSDIKKADQMTVSNAGIQFIMGQEALCSLSPTKKVFTKKAVDPNTPIYSYLDSNGKYSIGYGNQYLADGTPVTVTTIILAKDAPSILNKHITDRIEIYLKGVITAPLTQQMYDALIDMAYNAGGPALAKSTIITSINTQKYEEAAALIPMWRATAGGVANAGLTSRRLAEQAMFLSGGIPNASFTDVDKLNPTPQQIEKAAAEAAANQSTAPTTTNNTPTGTGTVNTSVPKTGFKDPNAVYPLNALKGEPDTNRLARNERIYESIVFAKEAAMAKRIKKYRWKKLKKEWSQPDIPYNARYPFNQTRVTESGHVEEWDDTKGSERIHKYHRAGTFEEIDANGTRVTRIVGDNYEILERNGNLVVRGNVNITVQGNADIRVENDANFEVLGNLNTSVTGDWYHRQRGDIHWDTEGEISIKNMKTFKIHSDQDIGIESVQSITTTSGANTTIGAVGNITEMASRIDLNPGGKPSAPEPLIVDEWEEATGSPSFGHLVVIDRTTELGAQYESPHEGDASTYINQQVARGEFSLPDTTAPAQDTGETTGVSTVDTPPTSIPTEKNNEIKAVTPTEEITANYRLSPNYRLSDIIGASEKVRIPTDSFGGRAQVKQTQVQVVKNLQYLAINVLEPVKAQFPNMIVTSSWRSGASNSTLPGASKTSDHLIGGAVDMVFKGFDNAKLLTVANTIANMLPTFNQILVEYKGDQMWIHVSAFASDSGINNSKQKGSMLVAGKTTFKSGFLPRTAFA